MFTDITGLSRKGYKWSYDEKPSDLKKVRRLFIKRFGKDKLKGFYSNPNIDIWVLWSDLKFHGKYPVALNIFRKKVKRLFPNLPLVFINLERLKERPIRKPTPLEQLQINFDRVQRRLLEAKRMYYVKHKSIMTDYEFDILEKYSFKLAKSLGYRADKYKGPKKNEKHHIHWMIGYKKVKL
jgi:hypothetical protein